ncbi:MAG: hypothetical protein ACRDL5_03900, partial [Solirubrobacteraceae bacterium]
LAGAVLGAVLVALFLWGQAEVQSNALYQRPDWRGVAAALGSTSQARAIAAYPGQFATGPLSFYLPRVAWGGPGSRPFGGSVTVSELDVVANAGPPLTPPTGGARTISAAIVDGYQVVRYALPAPVHDDGAQLAARAQQLLPVPGSGPTVIVQRGSD